MTWIAHKTFNESGITNLDGMTKIDSNLRDPNDNFQNQRTKNGFSKLEEQKWILDQLKM